MCPAVPTMMDFIGFEYMRQKHHCRFSSRHVCSVFRLCVSPVCYPSVFPLCVPLCSLWSELLNLKYRHNPSSNRRVRRLRGMCREDQAFVFLRVLSIKALRSLRLKALDFEVSPESIL